MDNTTLDGMIGIVQEQMDMLVEKLQSCCGFSRSFFTAAFNDLARMATDLTEIVDQLENEKGEDDDEDGED